MFFEKMGILRQNVPILFYFFPFWRNFAPKKEAG
jgi:hypothetical protein